MSTACAQTTPCGRQRVLFKALPSPVWCVDGRIWLPPKNVSKLKAFVWLAQWADSQQFAISAQFSYAAGPDEVSISFSNLSVKLKMVRSFHKSINRFFGL